VLAFAAPPAFMMFSAQQYLAKTRDSVEDVRRANDELRRAIGQLEERNADLKELLDFAAGLAARAHDRSTLSAYAREALRRVAGAPVDVSEDPNGPIPLVAGGARVGSITLADPAAVDERWDRLREVMLPHLATALESTRLVEEVRRKHLATIAALSRSMEAKDYYTGGHTERVAEISVALARRFGFDGEELDAIEIGALLHDIGKIGIPERILHKPGPLDDDEWRLMKEHPVISDYILSEIDLHPFVRQIARSSHERIDGDGYPDRLKGDAIPITARIVLVADALDALTTDRPYRRARPLAAALDELRAHTGTQFCPKVIAAVETLWREHPEVLGAGRLQIVATGA
jgi:HD-GYP domain-containing protein (c-di-GMP phosphodiesterase class II)